MYRRHHHTGIDEANLQTDVMRFMAIVAFCLIAILAVVRNIDVPPPVATTTQITARAETNELLPQAPAANSPTVSTPEPAEQIRVDPEPQPRADNTPSWPRPETATPDSLASPAGPAPARKEPEKKALQKDEPEENKPVIAATEKPDVPPADPAAAASDPVVEEQPDTPRENGLTLRFASDSDFLRLVNRGKITVFAYDKDTFLSLGPDYHFRPAQKPRQVYELHASTIPGVLLESLRNSSQQQQLRWAVSLPERIARQITEHVRKHKSGELRIDRFQKVHHVLSS